MVRIKKPQKVSRFVENLIRYTFHQIQYDVHIQYVLKYIKVINCARRFSMTELAQYMFQQSRLRKKKSCQKRNIYDVSCSYFLVIKVFRLFFITLTKKKEEQKLVN